MNVRFDLDQISTTAPAPAVARSFNANLDLKLWTDFLMFDEDAGSATAPNGSKAGGIDYVAGFWDAKDIVDEASCGSGHPFSGKGWEGNYDGASNAPVPSGTSIKPTEDPYCLNPANAATCSNIKRDDAVPIPSAGRSTRGDVIPLDWRVEQQAGLPGPDGAQPRPPALRTSASPATSRTAGTRPPARWAAEQRPDPALRHRRLARWARW